MMAQVMLLSYFAKYCKNDSLRRGRALSCTFATVLASGLFLYFAVYHGMPEPVKLYLLHNYKKYLFIVFSLYVLMAYFYPRNWRKGVYVMTLLFAVPGFIFNPLTRVPNCIISNLPEYINVNAGTNQSRVLFVTGGGAITTLDD